MLQARLTYSQIVKLVIGLADGGVSTSKGEGFNMTSVDAEDPERCPPLDPVAAGAFVVMIGASIVLSGLLLIAAPIISDMYYQKDAAGRVVLRTLPNGMKVPVEINGGQGAFLIYFSIVTFAIVISLMLFASRLLARYGSHVMLIVGGVIMTHGLALFATSSSNLTFYIAGALLGLGYGMSIALVPPALINVVRRKTRPRARHCAVGTGVNGLIWATIGPSLAQSSLGWRGVTWIMAASMAVCTIVPALFLIKNTPADVGLDFLRRRDPSSGSWWRARFAPGAVGIHLQAGPQELELLDRLRVILDVRRSRIRHAGAFQSSSDRGIPQPTRQDVLDARAGRVLSSYSWCGSPSSLSGSRSSACSTTRSA